MAAEIRAAGPEDIDRLAADRVALFAEAGQPLPAAESASLARSTARVLTAGLADRTVRGWVARDSEGRWLGSAVVCVLQRMPTPANPAGREAYLAQMVVAESARRTGLGRALLDRAIDDARADGIAVMRLRTTPAARRLYSQSGFTVLADVMQLALGDFSADRA